MEKFDEGLESDKKEYVQKRAEIAPIPSNSTDNVSGRSTVFFEWFINRSATNNEIPASDFLKVLKQLDSLFHYLVLIILFPSPFVSFRKSFLNTIPVNRRRHENDGSIQQDNGG